ncbi:unnamed protein product [Dibothriocephalus latus]|uniref:Uncharacterized protein n=1 Tax=Dibothriocephalus latus TaxID=60516 RepID=A0A3P7LY81_DIBLA|nr:unnamed protein product [Dibothriocephalus latus]
MALFRFSGHPKVHKEGASLRPFVSLKGTPTYGLAKWLFRRLNFLTADSANTDLTIENVGLLLRSKYDELEKRLGHNLVLQRLKSRPRDYSGIYEQVKGRPMSSPILDVIAETVPQ